MTDNHAPPGEGRPRAHVKLPRTDYDTAKRAAEKAGVTVPVYLAGLVQADKVERAQRGAFVLHAIGVIRGDVDRWENASDNAALCIGGEAP